MDGVIGDFDKSLNELDGIEIVQLAIDFDVFLEEGNEVIAEKLDDAAILRQGEIGEQACGDGV